MDELILEAGRADGHYWRDLWRFRDLFAFLAWRDFIVRYKQTVFGVLWAVVRPFITMVIFVVIFRRVANLPSQGLPYAIIVLGGLLPWQLFATVLESSGNSLVNNGSLITKTYFPRLILPASTAILALVDFMINLGLLAGVMLWFQYVPPWQIIFLPVFILLSVAAAAGPGLIAASLNVKYRDFRVLIPFIVQFGLYVSPVGFRSSLIEERLGSLARLVYSLNPMVGVIDGFRWCIGVEPELHLGGLCISVAVIGFFLWIGIRFFRSTEKGFADVV